MLEAITGLGYRPSQDGGVVASVDTPRMKVSARTTAAGHAADADGAIVVTLEPKGGQQTGGVKVRVVPVDGVTVANPEVEVKEALTASREVSIPIHTAKGAAAGPRTVTVQVTTPNPGGAARTHELRVQVSIQ